MELKMKLTLVALFVVCIQIGEIACNPTAENHFKLECNELDAVGTWFASNLTFHDYGHYNYTATTYNITLKDKSCSNFIQNGQYVSIRYKFNECGTIIREESAKLIHENEADVIVHFDTQMIRRSVLYKYTMMCMVDRSKNVSSSLGYNITDSVTRIVDGTDTSSYELLIALFTTNKYSSVATGTYTVKSFQPIYIGINEVADNPNLKFTVQRCFATPGSMISSTPAYIFYEERCPIDNSFKQDDPDNKVGKNFNFQIEAFKFIEIKKRVFIHCEVYICKEASSSGLCNQKCGGTRKRRAVDSGEGALEKVSLTTTEIVYDDRITTCKDLTCQENSNCVDLYPAVCRCNDGYVLNQESKRCENERVLPVFGIHLDMAFQEAFRDPNTRLYNLLAREAEEDLLLKLKHRDQYRNVAGVKVVSFSPGSVVMDVLLIYKSTPTEAFAALVAALTQPDTSSPTSNSHKTFSYKIKKDKIPTLSKPKEKTLWATHGTTVIWIAVIVPSVAIVFIALLAYKAKMSAILQSRDVELKGVHGNDNGGVAVDDVVIVRD